MKNGYQFLWRRGRLAAWKTFSFLRKYRMNVLGLIFKMLPSLQKEFLDQRPIPLAHVVGFLNSFEGQILSYRMLEGILDHRFQGLRRPTLRIKRVKNTWFSFFLLSGQCRGNIVLNRRILALQKQRLELNERPNQLIRSWIRFGRKHAGLMERTQHSHHRSNVLGRCAC